MGAVGCQRRQSVVNGASSHLETCLATSVVCHLALDLPRHRLLLTGAQLNRLGRGSPEEPYVPHAASQLAGRDSGQITQTAFRAAMNEGCEGAAVPGNGRQQYYPQDRGWRGWAAEGCRLRK